MKKSLSDIMQKVFGKDAKNVDFKEIGTGFKGVILKVMVFIEKNKRNARWMAPLALITFVLAIVLALRTYKQIKYLDTQRHQLLYIENYDTYSLNINKNTQKEMRTVRTVQDLIDFHDEKAAEVQRYEDYLDSLKVPYDSLLQFLYLPRLHIRKDPFLEKIDTTLVGRNFLEENPYDDIVLLQKWTDFFKKVGQNESNQVTDILI